MATAAPSFNPCQNSSAVHVNDNILCVAVNDPTVEAALSARYTINPLFQAWHRGVGDYIQYQRASAAFQGQLSPEILRLTLAVQNFRAGYIQTIDDVTAENIRKTYTAAFKYLGLESRGIRLAFSTGEAATAEFDPLAPDTITIFLNESTIADFKQSIGKDPEFAATLLHEYYHREEILGPENGSLVKAIRSLAQEINVWCATQTRPLRSADNFRSYFAAFLTRLHQTNPDLANDIAIVLERQPTLYPALEYASQELGDKIHGTMKRFLLTLCVNVWLKRNSDVYPSLPINTKQYWANSISPIASSKSMETAAYRLTSLAETPLEEPLPTSVNVTYFEKHGFIARKTGDTVVTTFPPTTKLHSWYQILSLRRRSLWSGGQFVVFGSINSLSPFLDWLNFAYEFQNPENSALNHSLDFSQAALSTAASAAWLTTRANALAPLSVMGSRVMGPLGASAAVAFSTNELIKDARREDTSGWEVGWDSVDVGSNTAVLGATVFIALTVGSGGTLIPVLIIVGGIGLSIGAKAAKAEAEENRVADSLAQAFGQIQEGASADQLHELLTNIHNIEIDDYALMDFFEMLDQDSEMRSPNFLRRPELSEFRERAIRELGGEGWFAYQGDKEGAYRMYLALQHKTAAAEQERKVFLTQIAQTLDASDWEEFDQLLARYNLSTNDLDTTGAIKQARSQL